MAETLDNRAPAAHQKGNVAAERFSDMLKKPRTQAQIKQRVERAQHRRGVGRSAAKSAANGNALLQAQLHW